MKNTLLIFLLLYAFKSISQIGVNATGSAPNPKAILDISSTNKGLLIPRMTLTQRNAISSAPGITPEGLTIFDTDTKNLWIYKNLAWVSYLPSPWEASGTDIFNNNTGSVMIGTTTPSFPNKLYVVANGTDGIRVVSDAGCSLCAQTTTASAVSGTASGSGIGGYFSSATGYSLITGPGNVGFGTFNPTQKLDIDGQIRIRGGSPDDGKVLTSSVDGTAIWQVANDHNHIGQTWTHSALNGLTITNFASADFNVAIRGFANSALRSKGILGSSSSASGVGVYGINSIGVSFFSPQDNSGVSGIAGTGTGVYGGGYSGRGVWGISNSAEGVYGSSTTGISILGQKSASATTGSAGVFEVLNASNTSSALVARSTGPVALEIDGAIKVNTGASNKPIFTHVAAAGNISGITFHITTLTYPNPTATDFVMVTPNYTAGPVYNTHPIGVYWNGSKWAIFNQDLASMPVGTAFNVMVIRQ